MTKRTGGQILVDQLKIQGCDRIFTVPGESFLAVLDALHDTPEIDTVVCRQEGGVSYMADADGKMTGRPGIAFVTRGPGATNASAGVHVAFQDSTPMILFIGDVARGDRDREGFQEIDFPAFFGPIAKWAARIEDARRIPEYVYRAYRVATAGRPGPVVLALPEDMLRDEVEAARPPARSAGRGRARSRRGPGPVRAAQGGRVTRSRSSAAPTGARVRRIISRTSPSATAFPSRPPSAARTRSPTHAASMPGSSATAPIPSFSSASATRT